MSDRIEVGDLVVVVRTCCDRLYQVGGGRIGTVTELAHDEDWDCLFCGASGSGTKARAFSGQYDAAPVAWLRKIPPFPELANEKTDDRISDLVLK